MIEQVDDGILSSEAGLISKLKGILMWSDYGSELVQEESFQDLHYVGGQFHSPFVIVQLFVVIFLCINLLLIGTFFSKEFFYTTMRYMFFAVTLMSDSFMLIMSNILLLWNFFCLRIQFYQCVIIYIPAVIFTFVTPITLTAMTLERYVAICMPLRHADLCSTRNTVHVIVIIHGLSSVPITIILCFFASPMGSVFMKFKICSMDMFNIFKWHNYFKLAVYQFYFLIMSITIFFSYIAIVKVPKAASGENKKSTWKGLRTVALHGFQLRLIQLWSPLIESAMLEINLQLFKDVRYFNYLTFSIAPRCLSPLIYDLRDENFFGALKSNVCFGFSYAKIQRNSN
ncbi:odorant receptor 131-2-like [Pelmatolapia mariae]|uniref:odorant receptor 131-2-like n=1 Tax=Pelmatolapia mariae TaxID=158779 RepID=UPI002FE50D9E